MSRTAALALAALALAAAPAGGQDRPSEEDLFGAPEQSARPEESQLSGAPPAARAAPPPPQGIVSREREDTTRVGGQLYLRAASLALEGQEPGDFSLSSPNLLDVYLDARPNDRVRAFVVGRMSWDPTLPPPGGPALSGAPLGGGLLRRGDSEPRAVLDQLWVNFDVGRTLFVTAGRQHAKWGVGRFWNPTDYLHPVKRDPLAVFDPRVGTAMVKLHLPWEARGWNAYAVAVLEDVAGDPPLRPDGTREGASRLGRVGVGGRAEIVLGPMELGADALAQEGHRPRFGVDVSAGVWDLDLYAEAAIRTTVDTPRWREVANPATASPFDLAERHDPVGSMAQLVVGGTYAVKYSDEDAVTFGAEYFYDESGYDSPRIYPALLAVASLSPGPAAFPDPLGGPPIANEVAGQPSPFTSFYLGRHYGGAFVSLPAPGSWNDTTFTLSVLGNLSDKSFVARLDHSLLALTYLRVETFAVGHFGAREGELRLGLDLPPEAAALGLPAKTEPLVFEAGVALRVSL